MMQTSTTPRTAFDCGWLFLIPGAVLIMCAVLIPSSDDLVELRYRQAQLSTREVQVLGMLEGYASFLDAVEENDPELVRRLAVSQFNLVPSFSEPVAMIGLERDASIDLWIQQTMPIPPAVERESLKPSRLRRFCTGPGRLWIVGIGACLVFFGLLPPVVAAKTKEQSDDLDEDVEEDDEPWEVDELDDDEEWDEDEDDEYEYDDEDDEDGEYEYEYVYEDEDEYEEDED